MKTCTKCGTEKPLDAFDANRGSKDGKHSNCKACRRLYAQANAETLRAKRRKFYVNNRDRELAKMREWRSDNAEAKRAADRRYNAANPNRARLRVAEWSAANPERVKETHRRWQARNPDKLLAEKRKRRAVQLAAPGRGISAADWRNIKADAFGHCSYCGDRSRLTLDHVEPLSRGGEHDPDNALAACRKCNCSKNDLPLVVWLATKATA